MSESVVDADTRIARSVHVRGVVQGVGFRPYVFRLAHLCGVGGWVSNGPDGVRIHVEGERSAVDAFVRGLPVGAPPAASLAAVHVSVGEWLGLSTFDIRESTTAGAATTRMSPDLAVCDACVRELFTDPDRRHRYAYINCTNCGPRFSIIQSLPYDRPRTTMAWWPMCADCAAEYANPSDRRFHAQPIACPSCGPHYTMFEFDGKDPVQVHEADVIGETARRLRGGEIVAIKGIGGYHIACDAANPDAVRTLRKRKVRKEKPFALMVRDHGIAAETIELAAEADALLSSAARPIVVCRSRLNLIGVAPGIAELGVMLPYTPLHHLLFDCGAPPRLVMTSGNRSDEPIAYQDDKALKRTVGLADAILIGERPIARRVDDSVVRVTASGPVMIRRSRGYAPGAVAHVPTAQPILAVGADLKNAVTIVVDGVAYVGQHIGDLGYADALVAFRESVHDLTSMYGMSFSELIVAHDCHPQYASTRFVEGINCRRTHAVQHHRAHIASVLAERGEFDRRVIGVAFDGSGYGDDGSIWGGELFAGSVREGFTRVAHLRPAVLPGGDAAAQCPEQAAAGFLCELADTSDLSTAPFGLSSRYELSRRLVARGVRCFRTTSAGRLFDTVAALLGFKGQVSYEGQAAVWLETLAGGSRSDGVFEMPLRGVEIDWRPAMQAILSGRRSGRDPADMARMFHRGLARATAAAASAFVRAHSADAVVLSGGVFQNALLLRDVLCDPSLGGISVLRNSAVPANDGGISLGQAALAAWR